MQLEKRSKAISSIQSTEKSLQQSYRACLERAEVAESARLVLEREYEHVQEELMTQEGHVRELEGCVNEEREKREEEVGSLEEQLEQERRRKEQELSRCSQVINELKNDLETKVLPCE